MNLYQIEPEFLALLQKEEYTAEDLEKIDSLSNSEKDKIIKIAGYIKNITAEYDAIEKATDNMLKRSKRLDKKIEWLTNIIMNKMELLNIDKITDSPHYEIALYKNRPYVDSYDDQKIPREYFIRSETYTLNKANVREDIERGIDVPGARLVQSKRLSIK